MDPSSYIQMLISALMQGQGGFSGGMSGGSPNPYGYPSQGPQNSGGGGMLGSPYSSINPPSPGGSPGGSPYGYPDPNQIQQPYQSYAATAPSSPGGMGLGAPQMGGANPMAGLNSGPSALSGLTMPQPQPGGLGIQQGGGLGPNPMVGLN